MFFIISSFILTLAVVLTALAVGYGLVSILWTFFE